MPLRRLGLDPALTVIAAGVCAALHVGKLPPAIAALQAALGLTLVQAGFLLSLVQLAGMSLGVAFGLAADTLGPRRSVLLGLATLSLASALGGLSDAVPLLMLLRAVEGFGFLLVVLPAPGLVHRLAAPGRSSVLLGIWGAYMPIGTAVALLSGPLWIEAFGWRAWWWLLAAISAAMAIVFAQVLPAAGDAPAQAGPDAGAWVARVRRTLGTRGPWLVAVSFAMYSSQWLSVIGFLPTIYTQAGISGATTGALTALAAAVNMSGNMAAGRLQHAGIAPTRLLAIGFVIMGLAATAAFAGGPGQGLPPAARYAAVLLYSAVGGLIPGTLFALAVRLAPDAQTLGTTVGWVQQWSAFGQFAGPPLVAWIASRAGGWQFTWLATGACAAVGLVLMTHIRRQLAP
ncbi:MAG: MFS transporter [Burkholderiaceae bacterium]